jgi:malate dehydrogenase (oxaloacetate-decarboxylating)(NADP+)
MPATTSVNSDEKRAELRRAALEYHEFPTPGKIAIAPTKQLVNQHDLALAYSPGVAAPCEETWWRSSPTARPCSVWVTLAHWPPSR